MRERDPNKWDIDTAGVVVLLLISAATLAGVYYFWAM